MKRVDDKKNIASFILCIICFCMGVSIPGIYSKLTENHSTEWKKMENVYSIMKDKWYFSKDIENVEDVLIEQAIQGMSINEIDPHTNYFSLEQAAKFSQSLEGSNVGIGFMYYENADHCMVVKNVFMDSPADRAGFVPGDIIQNIDGLDCSKEDVETVLNRIQERANEEMDVIIQRGDELMNIKLTPTTYDSTVICNVYEDYGEIILTSFSESSGKDFDLSMKRLQDKGIKKLIIDLRDNTGGYLTSVLDISSCLLPKDSLVFYEEDKNGNRTDQISSNKYEPVEMDSIVILQNDKTASASEVLIGALKSHLKDKVTTVGVTSYGKGTEQVSIPFTDGTSIKYTVAKWFTPDDVNINNVGFEPDVEVNKIDASSVTYLKMEEDSLIKPDEVHPNAKALQVYLKFLGYEVDREDTYFSYKSSSSLEQFQADHNLPVTGECDYTTWGVIMDDVLLKLNLNYHSYDNLRQKALEILK